MRISQINGVGDVLTKKFFSLGISTVDDLILSLPKSYVDMDAAFSLSQSADGDFCAFCGEIVEIAKPYKKGKLSILHAKAKYDKIEIKLIFYNQPYYSKTLKINEKYLFFGKMKKEDIPLFINPKVDLLGGKKLTGLRPVYRTKGLIAQGVYSNIVKEAFQFFSSESILSARQEAAYGLPSLLEAYRTVHFPQKTDLSVEKERIMLENVVKRICAFRYCKTLNKFRTIKKHYKKVDFAPLERLLPFVLSDSQRAAVEKMTEDLERGEDLNAILCGDVGSGKTIVAVFLCYYVIKNGYKAAFMAPTSILAKQHFSFINQLFSPLGIKVGFLTGATKKREKERLYFDAENEKYDIFVGTHSLLNEELVLPSLGLIVTDEQHRFGVAQRTRLISKGSEVAVLTMSATPIPRSLRLVAYGEVEFLTIDRPRKSNVKTRIVTANKRVDMWKYVNNICLNGKQAYVIAPRIFDEEGSETDSVEALFEELVTYIPNDWIGTLHGKMKAEEKQAVLDAFYRNEKKVLLSTTVVEVGIDVKNATVMVVCDAERFGLATLHQLRGRIGRGTDDGYCFLYTEKEPSDGLKALVVCRSGAEIAEKDFEMRGGGDVFGLEQSGKGSLDGLNLRTLTKASEIADGIDPESVVRLLWEEIERFSLGDVSLN